VYRRKFLVSVPADQLYVNVMQDFAHSVLADRTRPQDLPGLPNSDGGPQRSVSRRAAPITLYNV